MANFKVKLALKVHDEADEPLQTNMVSVPVEAADADEAARKVSELLFGKAKELKAK